MSCPVKGVVLVQSRREAHQHVHLVHYREAVEEHLGGGEEGVRVYLRECRT